MLLYILLYSILYFIFLGPTLIEISYFTVFSRGYCLYQGSQTVLFWARMGMSRKKRLFALFYILYKYIYIYNIYNI